MIDGRRADEVHIAFNFRVMDGDGDGGVSPEELQAYYAESGDDPLLHASSPAAVRGDALFVRLDRDGDGAIRPDDLGQFDVLFEQDLDRNRVLTEEELRGPRVSYGREFVARPFRRPSPDDSSPLSVRIVRDDGSPVDAALILDLAPNSCGDVPTPTLEVLSDVAGIAIEADAGPGTVAIRLFGRRVEVCVVPPPVRGIERVADTLQREFFAADGDADGQLTMSPDLPRFLRESFGLLDHSGDGRLDQAELAAYRREFLPVSAALGAARISITAHDEVRGLLALADQDRDGRLGARELKRARDLASRLMPADGELTAAGLPAVIRVELRPAGIELPYVDDAATEPGPPWFVHADVNRDGDVDQYEFLGNRSDFRRVDRDGDGLIDLAEAAGFDAVARSAESAALDVTQ
jgi:Ca2+-binding EF-hand superfamily protein